MTLDNLPNWFAVSVHPSHNDWYCFSEFNNLSLPNSEAVVEDIVAYDLFSTFIPDKYLPYFTLPDGSNLARTYPMQHQIADGDTLYALDEDTPKAVCFVSRDGRVIDGMDYVSLDGDFNEIADDNGPNFATIHWARFLLQAGYSHYSDLANVDMEEVFTQIYGITPADLGAQLFVDKEPDRVWVSLYWCHPVGSGNPPSVDEWTEDQNRRLLQNIVHYTGNYALLEN